MAEPVTSAWAQYAAFWQPLIVGGVVFVGLAVILGALVLVQLERLIRKR